MSWWNALSVALQYLLLAMLGVVAPWMGWRHARELRSWTSAELRLSLVQAGALQAWLVAAVSMALLPRHDSILMVRLGPHDMPWLQPLLPGQAPAWWLALAASVAGVLVVLAPGMQCLLNPQARQRHAASVRPYRFIAPVTRRERRMWIGVSLTAAICEELLFRGFLVQFLRGQSGSGLHLGLTAAWLLAALVFGLGHLYQGMAKAVQIGLYGLVLGMVAILTGNLVLPVLLHFVLDLQLLWVYRPEVDDPAQARALAEGCSLA